MIQSQSAGGVDDRSEAAEDYEVVPVSICTCIVLKGHVMYARTHHVGAANQKLFA